MCKKCRKRTPLYMRIKGDFAKAVLCPFLICIYRKHLIETFLWVMFVIFAGLLGPIINVIRRSVFMGWDFSVALIPDSLSGTFYTFSLVLVASLLAPLFISFSKDEKPNYQHIGMVLVTLMFFTMIFCAVFYSFAASDTALVQDFSKLTRDNVSVDFWQLLFFIIAIVFAIYCHGFSLLKLHEAELNMAKDHYVTENKEKEYIVEKTADITTDGNGVGL